MAGHDHKKTNTEVDEYANDHHHIIPFEVLAKVCGALLALTVLTVVTSQMHLGVIASSVAFLIAFIKAMLVVMFFMGLKYDRKSNAWIFGSSFIFLAIFIFFSALDIWTRIAETSPL